MPATDTILDWLLAAGHHAQAIEEMLLKNYQLSRGQLDALWSYVGNKGKKKSIPKRTSVANSGEQR